MVLLPQELVPASNETAITSIPAVDVATLPPIKLDGTPTRIYGPAVAGAGSPLAMETIYTVPVGKRVILTNLLAANVDAASPILEAVFSMSIGVDSGDNRIFNNAVVDPGQPLALQLQVTLEAGEIIQALSTNVALTLDAKVTDV